MIYKKQLHSLHKIVNLLDDYRFHIGAISIWGEDIKLSWSNDDTYTCIFIDNEGDCYACDSDSMKVTEFISPEETVEFLKLYHKLGD